MPFVVLHLGRTGSTYLVEALDSHPRVTAGYEELAALRERGATAAEQLAHARAAFAGDGDVAAAGFKTKLRDVLDPEGFAALLREVDARVIHLGRRNLVKLTVSVFTSERIHGRTGVWNAYAASGVVDEPLAIDPQRFREMLDGVVRTDQRLRDYVQRLDRPALELSYEDLAERHDETLDRALSFLGVPPRPCRGRTLKATRDDLRAVIANFEELRGCVAGTEYEAMLLDADAATSR